MRVGWQNLHLDQLGGSKWDNRSETLQSNGCDGVMGCHPCFMGIEWWMDMNPSFQWYGVITQFGLSPMKSNLLDKCMAIRLSGILKKTVAGWSNQGNLPPTPSNPGFFPSSYRRDHRNWTNRLEMRIAWVETTHRLVMKHWILLDMWCFWMLLVSWYSDPLRHSSPRQQTTPQTGAKMLKFRKGRKQLVLKLHVR